MKCTITVLLVTSFAVNVWANMAEEIIQQTGVKGGLVVVLGLEDSELVTSFSKEGSFVVQGLDTNADNVAKARETIRAEGRYGTVSANQFDGEDLPYADDLANLIVIRDTALAPLEGEIRRVLAPRGIAVLDGRQIVKSVPMGIDDWTHYLYGPGNNAVSRDTAIGPVASLKWNCGPLWSRSHEFTSSVNILVSAGGRVFYVVDEGITSVTTPDIPERWVLIARDAFNGKTLWRIPLPEWRSRIGVKFALRAIPPTARRCLVAEEDSVYVSLRMGSPLQKLDAATGKVLRTYGNTMGVREFVQVGQTIILRKEQEGVRGKGSFCKIDCESGDILWSKSEGFYRGETLAANDRYVIYFTKTELVCIDSVSGCQLWRSAQKQRLDTYILHDDLVLGCGNQTVNARNARTGELVWQAESGGEAMRGYDGFVAQGCLWHASGTGITAYDLKTGKVVRSVDPTDVQSEGHHLRCYRAKATENYLITQYRGVEFVGIKGQGNAQTDWARGACSFGIVPANGLLYVPPNPCFCYPGVKVRGLNAFAPKRKTAVQNKQPQNRLLKGPAYGKLGSDNSTPASAFPWPTYRQGPARHSSVGESVPAEITRQWKTQLNGPVTPPTAALGKVFVAAKDAHAIHALDAVSGKTVWTFTAGARIDSPPTIDGKTALFGCTDGYVYCVTANTGQLVWKFLAAPQDRLIMSFDQLESTWPVHGSVLVKNGVVYCAAGRSTMMDGGIWLYGLKAATGELLYETNISTLKAIRDDFQGKPSIPSYVMEGAHTDVLVGEGSRLFMGPATFDLKLNRLQTPLGMDVEHKTVALDISKADYIIPDAELLEDGYQTYRSFHRWQEKAWPEMAEKYKAAFGNMNLGDMITGKRIAPTAGFLDGTWFNRTYWMYSNKWPGWYHGHRGAKCGNLLVVGAQQTYALQAYPERNKQSPLFTPGSKGYLLIADANNNEPVLDFQTRGATKGLGYTRINPPIWHQWIPVRIRGMVEAGDTLFSAGPPDVVDSADPYASFEGRKGGKLLAMKAANGKLIFERELESPPVFDGLIAANGKLFMTALDGSIVCYGKK